MSWIEDIGGYLQSQNVGIIGTDIFYGGLKAGKLNCIALFPRPGFEDIVSLGKSMTLCRPELGILIRNKAGNLAEQQARDIYNILNLKTNTTIGNTKFKRIRAISTPFLLSKSEIEGTEYSVNFEVEISK
mgnify:CR=1 FL=1|jgi:hypothetical protein